MHQIRFACKLAILHLILATFFFYHFSGIRHHQTKTNALKALFFAFLQFSTQTSTNVYLWKPVTQCRLDTSSPVGSRKENGVTRAEMFSFTVLPPWEYSSRTSLPWKSHLRCTGASQRQRGDQECSYEDVTAAHFSIQSL